MLHMLRTPTGTDKRAHGGIFSLSGGWTGFNLHIRPPVRKAFPKLCATRSNFFGARDTSLSFEIRMAIANLIPTAGT